MNRQFSLSQSPCKHVFGCAPVTGYRAHLFSWDFSFEERLHQQAIQSSTSTLFQPCLFNVSRMFCIVLLKSIHGCPHKRCSLHMFWCTFLPYCCQHKSVNEFEGHIHHWDRFLDFGVWIVLLSVVQNKWNTIFFPSRDDLEYRLIWPQYTFLPCNGPSQMFLSPWMSSVCEQQMTHFWHSKDVNTSEGSSTVVLDKVCQSIISGLHGWSAEPAAL